MPTLTLQDIDAAQINHILAYAKKEKLKIEISDEEFSRRNDCRFKDKGTKNPANLFGIFKDQIFYESDEVLMS